MRVLLVAPRKNDLASVDAEVQDIMRSGLEVTPLVGEVTATALLREIRDGEYDVLWLATHGNKDFIELSGEHRVTAEELVPLVRDRFHLVVLNTCDSWRIARMIQIQANVSVISSILNTFDTTAYKFGSLLSRELVRQPTIADAYLNSLFGNDDSYLYLPALRASADTLNRLAVEMREWREEMEIDRRWRWRLIIAGVGLHPVTWVIIYMLWRWG